jgi:hypothetical protein
MADGTTLTDAQLDSALTTLKLDLSNTDQMTQGAAAGSFLKASTPGAAATWALPNDPTTTQVRNYGLSASQAGGALTINLTTASGATPSTSSKVDASFSTSGGSSAVFQKIECSSATSLTIVASATLGSINTSSNRIYVYAIQTSTSTIKLGVSGNPFHDDGLAVTTVAMAASADNGKSLYASAALAVKARFLGCVEAARNSALAWQDPDRVSIGLAPLASMSVPTLSTSARGSKTTTVVGAGNQLSFTLTPAVISGSKNYHISIVGSYFYTNSNGTTLQTRPYVAIKDTTSSAVLAESASPSFYTVPIGYTGTIPFNLDAFVPIPTGTSYTIEVFEENSGGGTYTAVAALASAVCTRVLV